MPNRCDGCGAFVSSTGEDKCDRCAKLENYDLMLAANKKLSNDNFDLQRKSEILTRRLFECSSKLRAHRAAVWVTLAAVILYILIRMAASQCALATVAGWVR